MVGMFRLPENIITPKDTYKNINKQVQRQNNLHVQFTYCTMGIASGSLQFIHRVMVHKDLNAKVSHTCSLCMSDS